MNLEFMRVRDVKAPTRANSDDAGIDFFVPVIDDSMVSALLEKNNIDNYKLMKEDNAIYINPHCDLLVPSGVKVNIEPTDSALIAFNKSGVATKKKLMLGACVIDHSYTGEVHLHLINTSNYPVRISGGDKIAQFIHMPIFNSVPTELTTTEYNDKVTEKEKTRGSGGFGSSGTK